MHFRQAPHEWWSYRIYCIGTDSFIVTWTCNARPTAQARPTRSAQRNLPSLFCGGLLRYVWCCSEVLQHSLQNYATVEFFRFFQNKWLSCEAPTNILARVLFQGHSSVPDRVTARRMTNFADLSVSPPPCLLPKINALALPFPD